MAQINSKEIQKSLQDDVNARKDGTEKVKKLSDEVEKAKDNLKESNFELEKQTMQRDRAFAAGEDTLKLDESINKQKKKKKGLLKQMVVYFLLKTKEKI